MSSLLLLASIQTRFELNWRDCSFNNLFYLLPMSFLKRWWKEKGGRRKWNIEDNWNILWGEKFSTHKKRNRGERCAVCQGEENKWLRGKSCAWTRLCGCPAELLSDDDFPRENSFELPTCTALSVVCWQLRSLHDSVDQHIQSALEGKLAQESLPSLPVWVREKGKHKILFVMIFGEREKVLRFSRDYFMLPACTDLSESRACYFSWVVLLTLSKRERENRGIKIKNSCLQLEREFVKLQGKRRVNCFRIVRWWKTRKNFSSNPRNPLSSKRSKVNTIDSKLAWEDEVKAEEAEIGKVSIVIKCRGKHGLPQLQKLDRKCWSVGEMFTSLPCTTLGWRQIWSLNFHEIFGAFSSLSPATTTPPVDAVCVTFLSDVEQRSVLP